MKRRIAICLLVILLAVPAPAFAALRSDTARFTSGFGRVLMAPFHIPLHMLRGTAQGAPGFGTVGGVLTGTFATVGNLVGGAFDMTAAAAPYAKYAVFAL